MEKEALKRYLSDKIKDLEEILDSYANFSTSDVEFVNSVWMSAELVAQKFRSEVIKFELEEIISWNSQVR